jgi:hypothetical protein
MKPEDAKPGRAKTRRPRRIFILAAATAAAAVAAFVLIAPSYVSSESGRRFILGRINAAVDGRTEIGSLTMSWRKGIRATGIGFADTAGNVAFAADSIAVRPHYASLLTGSVSLGKTVVERPSLELTAASADRESAGPPADRGRAVRGGGGVPVKRADLFINDGTVKVTDADRRVAVLKDINAKLLLRPPGRRTSFDVSMAVTNQGRESTVGASADIRLAEKTGWTFDMAGGDLAVEVNDLDIASLGPFFALAGVELNASGRVSADIKGGMAEGGIESLEGVVKAENLDISSPGARGGRFGTGRLNAEVKIRRADGAVKVDRLDLVAAFGRVNCSGTFDSLDIDADLDLAQLQSHLGPFVDFKQMKMSGRVASRGSAALDPENGTYRFTTSDTTVRGLVLSHPGRQPFEAETGSVLLDAEIRPATKTISIKQLQVDTPKIKIRKGRFEKTDSRGTTSLRGMLDCEYDWQSVISLTRPYLPPHLELAGTRKQVLDFASTYPAERPQQLLPNMTTKAKIGFDRAEYLGLKFGPTETDLGVENGTLTIAPFTSAVNDGRVSFGGSADLRQQPALLRIPGRMQIARDVQINDETTKALLSYLNPIFAGAIGVKGTVDFDCEKLAIPLGQASGRDILMAGTISIKQMSLRPSNLLGTILRVAGMSFQDQQINVQPTKFALENGLLAYDDMNVLVGEKAFNFKGVIGLDKSLDMTITLPYGDEGTAGGGTTLLLKGTIDRPELDVGSIIKQQLEDRLRQGIREGLDKLLR